VPSLTTAALIFEMDKDAYIESKMKKIKCSCGGENTAKGRADIQCSVCGKDNTLEYVFLYKIIEDDYYRLHFKG
jgi:hypothetical protein